MESKKSDSAKAEKTEAEPKYDPAQVERVRRAIASGGSVLMPDGTSITSFDQLPGDHPARPVPAEAAPDERDAKIESLEAENAELKAQLDTLTKPAAPAKAEPPKPETLPAPAKDAEKK